MFSTEITLPELPCAVYRCTLQLTSSHSVAGSAHPLSIWEAIVKGITEQAGLTEQLRPLFYWPKKRALSMRVEFAQTVVLEVSLCGADAVAAQRWADTARHYFDEGQPGRNFRMLAVSEPQALVSDVLKMESLTEVCLDFFTPFPFATVRGKPRDWLDDQGFAKALALRIKKLTGKAVSMPTDKVQVLPFYWDYCQLRHASSSQAGHTKYLNGCVGKLYIKGSEAALANWLPWLLLAEQIGIGGQLSFGLGRFKLLLDSPAFFYAALVNPNAIAKVIHETLENYDDALPVLATEPGGVDEGKLAAQLAAQIKSGWQSEPYQAFTLPKSHGGYRIAEKAGFTARVVQRHVLAMLRDLLDKTFEEESIGYRKGLSRELVVQRVQDALAEGFEFVLESDVADFFPSVDLTVLQSRLDALLPVRDSLLRKTLAAILVTPRLLSGRLEQRERGLAVGSPLSPLLANVYLDVFDEQIRARGVRLIRFADDFIILTRDLETAEALLGVAEDSLHQLGLGLNLEKTAIRPIGEGFTFLGIRFGAGAEVVQQECPENLRKPVYITEPYVFLGTEADCLEVRHHSTVLASIPFKRISEILTLGPCSWSSALVSQCVEAEVPIVLTAASGKHLATLGGSAFHHYDIAYRHAHKFYAMDSGQKLMLAKAFASGKLHNYTSLIRQRYRTGNHKLLDEFQRIIADMWSAEDVSSLRGLEGIAAQKAFTQFGGWIEAEGFRWEGRKRRPPDRINSLLNFTYHLLFCRINVVLRGEGLNPFLGFLHDANGRYEALVCDIQELFRPHADRLVIRLVNLAIIKQMDFKQTDHGFWLTAEAKGRVLEEFSRELDHEPLAHSRATLNEAIVLQVRSLRKFFLEDSDVQFFRW